MNRHLPKPLVVKVNFVRLSQLEAQILASGVSFGTRRGKSTLESLNVPWIAKSESLQLDHELGHHTARLILLSRIDGDAPRA